MTSEHIPPTSNTADQLASRLEAELRGDATALAALRDAVDAWSTAVRERGLQSERVLALVKGAASRALSGRAKPRSAQRSTMKFGGLVGERCMKLYFRAD